jgi:adenylylsulfate kinase
MQKGFTLWFTGLSGAGKTTISSRVAPILRQRGVKVEVLDGDVIRDNLSTRLGFSKEDRDENIKRIGWICELLTRNDVATLAAAISPYRAARDAVRSRVQPFVLVFCDAPLEVLAERDVKGLYKRAMAGEIKNFTGVDDPYERPETPDVHLDTAYTTIEHCVGQVIQTLEEKGLIPKE